ncbi:MAG: hypothetical protein F6K11_25720 [Leptolyngbya sp. SIO3F4]|nr:hypothetical protein [Leptolyngbya sp. SIO3F4]
MLQQSQQWIHHAVVATFTMLSVQTAASIHKSEGIAKTTVDAMPVALDAIANLPSS